MTNMILWLGVRSSSQLITVFPGPYDPPEGSGVNTCRCNVDVYSLLSACSYCQGGAVGTWSDWIAFCPSSYIHDSYPEKVPDQTDIPSWADLNITATGVWNATAAQQFAGKCTIASLGLVALNPGLTY